MKHEAGFTLIEMLVALALTATIAVAGSALLTSTLRGADRLTEVAGMAQDIDLAHALMRDDFANIVEDPDAFAGNRTGDNAVLISLQRKGAFLPVGAEGETAPGTVNIEYRMVRGNLVRRIWKAADASGLEPDYADRLLASGLTYLQLTYFDGREWQTDWRDDREELPKAVAFRMEYGAADMLTQYYLVGGGG